MSCEKVKLDKFEAMLIVAQSTLKQKIFKNKCRRRESRIYYCKKCDCYHTTSKDDIIKNEI